MKERSIQSVRTDERSISQAVESALDVLGPVSKKRLFQYLMYNYELDLRSTTTADLNKIKLAILDLFGYDAAGLLMKLIYSEVDKLGP
jgi:hypothetical protein